MCSGVYAIVNNLNGKLYIGSAVNLRVRKLNHFAELQRNRHDNSKLQRAYNKYGMEAFSFKVLMANVPKEELIFMEQSYMDKHDSFVKGYNLKPVARNMLGFIHSDESKSKIATSLKGRVVSEETRTKLSKATNEYMKTNKDKAYKNIDRTNIKHSSESKMKMSTTKKAIKGLNARCLKLTSVDVLEAKMLRSEGVTLSRIAIKFNVSRPTITRYINDSNKNTL